MRSLTIKLILSFLAVSLSGTALIAVLAGRTTANEFGHFLFGQNRDTIVAGLADYYRAHQGWEGVEDRMPFRGMSMAVGPGMAPAGGFALADASGRVIVPSQEFSVGTQFSPAELANDTPIQLDGKVIGYLILGGNGFRTITPAGAEFLARINRILILSAIGATGMALLLAIILARALTRPLRELTAATHAVAGGDLVQQVPVRSRDELGQLAEAFNQMSGDLAHSQALRRQMTADVAHELRTPLTIVQGHTEALRDGVIAAAPENLAIVHDEVVHLNRLVEDLRTLSLAEAGELSLYRQLVSPEALLKRAAAAQAPRAHYQNITLQTEVEPDLPMVEVDADRMGQVLNNLLDNAMQHTPSGGTVALLARGHLQSVQLMVRDTGTGIAPEDLPLVFDRFYRADNSRQRNRGGSGLGLAIARSIVEAHAGRIWAESKLGEGTTITIEWPVGTGRG